jgi:hypothetical protein
MACIINMAHRSYLQTYTVFCELSVGIEEHNKRKVIRLKNIYNFLCSMLVYTPFALCFVTLRGVFMHFPELTY